MLINKDNKKENNMEEIKSGEQLESVVNTDENGAIMQRDDMVQDLQQNSSPIKKFKSLDELEKAYVNLEKEFTKKCQALNKLKEDFDNVSSKQSLEQTPEFSQAKLEQSKNEFFEKNPTAKEFADEILSAYDSDKSGDELDPLEKAYEKVKANHFRTNQELMQDENFVENYVLNNSQVRDRIINDYLSNIMSNKTTPLMSNFSGGSVMITPKSKPSSIKEAGDYMVALFNNK